MWTTWKRFWRYLAMHLRVRQGERADPKVQLLQAIDELRARHRGAVHQAAKVVAAERIAERRLDELAGQHAEQTRAANQAVLLATQQRQLGDPARAAVFEERAELIVVSVLAVEREMTDQRQVVEQTGRAAGQARALVKDNAAQLQRKLDQSAQLLNDIERTKMLEELNQANRQLDATFAAEGPTFDGVARKVEQGLQGAMAENDMAAMNPAAITRDAVKDVDDAVASVQAQARLDEIRGQSSGVLPDVRHLAPVSDDTRRGIAPPPRRRDA